MAARQICHQGRLPAGLAAVVFPPHGFPLVLMLPCIFA
jgi:hypothetical protein